MSYTLIYFNGRGRAELARFVFAQAGVEYEDKRVTGEEFGAMKKDLPTGSLPVLDFDGKRLSGSVPIAFYVADKNGLAGSTSEDRAFISAILDLLGDLQAKMVAAFFGSDEDAKAKAKKALEEEHFPRFLKNLENNFLAKNDSPDGWVYGNSVTIADLATCVLLDQVFQKESALAEGYPRVKKNIDAVKALPKIAEWIKKRPETPF